MQTTRSPLALWLCLLLAACSGDGGGEETAVREAARADRPTMGEQLEPDTRDAPTGSRRYESPEDFPFSFSTVVPAEMEVELLAEDGGRALRFTADYEGGAYKNAAYLQIFVHPQGTRVTRARSFAKSWVATLGLAVSRGIEPYDAEVPKRWEWSLVEYDFAHQKGDRAPGQWLVGTVAVAKHADRYFQVVLHYPENRAEEFVPLANRILEAWRWEATGAGLS